MENDKVVWLELLEWHKAQHGKDLAAAFELGDFMLQLMINTGLKKEQIIARIRREFGDLAYSSSTYRRASLLAAKFTPNQRNVLITRGVSYIRTVKLAGKEFDATRVKTIIEIKAGRLTKWGQIKSKLERQHLEETKTLRHGLSNVGDVIAIQLREHGQFQRDLMFDGIRALVSQVEQRILIEQLNHAVADCRKRGTDLKEFALKK